MRFEDNCVVEVTGASPDAVMLREMLIGGALIELGCGFNPKWPRHQIYPAGSNSPGALHFGIDLTKPSDYIKKVMPNWEEPPVHMDIVTFDSTVDAGSGTARHRRLPRGVARSRGRGDGVALRRPGRPAGKLARLTWFVGPGDLARLFASGASRRATASTRSSRRFASKAKATSACCRARS